MKLLRALLIISFVLFTAFAYSQDQTQVDSLSSKKDSQIIDRRHSIGSSLFMAYNLFPDSADYYILNYGYRITLKDNIICEALTWTYYEPLGTYGNSDELYPGKIRAYGIGFGYQRFHWKNFFTAVEATSFIQQYYDSDDEKIQKGFQLYLQFILGYHCELFKSRWFVEPAFALKYWPVNTNVPKSFADIEDGTPEYKFEPSLNFGYKF